jgi:hypothetical protein
MEQILDRAARIAKGSTYRFVVARWANDAYASGHHRERSVVNRLARPDRH